MKTTKHTDITAEILKEFAPIIKDIVDPFYDYEEDSHVHEQLELNIFNLLRKALHTQREEIVKSLRELEVQKLSGSGGEYDYSTNMAKWYNEGIDEAKKALDNKLELLK